MHVYMYVVVCIDLMHAFIYACNYVCVFCRANTYLFIYVFVCMNVCEVWLSMHSDFSSFFPALGATICNFPHDEENIKELSLFQVYCIGTILSMQISFVGFQPVQSSEHMAVSNFLLCSLCSSICAHVTYIYTYVDIYVQAYIYISRYKHAYMHGYIRT